VSSGERCAGVGELELCYQTLGADTLPPLLLVMGLASQMVLWDDEFCQALANRGLLVIRFDNRDIGAPRSCAAGRRRRAVSCSGDRRAASYSLDDMADDAAGLVDHLDVRAAHVVGVSMGGMIAQLLGDPASRPRPVAGLDHVEHRRSPRRPHRPGPVPADAPTSAGRSRGVRAGPRDDDTRVDLKAAADTTTRSGRRAEMKQYSASRMPFTRFNYTTPS
jgi:pimeloyl-ACP methyl ester carboxylesterase